VVIKAHSEQVVRLALETLDPGIEREKGLDRRLVVTREHPHPSPTTTRQAEQIHHHFEASGSERLGQSSSGVIHVVHGTQIDAHLVARVPQGPDEGVVAARLRYVRLVSAESLDLEGPVGE
jgi:hypothetical protein